MRFETLTKLSLAAGIAAAIGLSSGIASAKTLRFSHTDNPGGSRQAAAEVFAEKVKEYTEGRYEVRIFPRASSPMTRKLWSSCNWVVSTSR